MSYSKNTANSASRWRQVTDLLAAIYLNINMRKFESSQSYESEATSVDCLEACSKLEFVIVQL